jgi:hypothetical protein
MANRSCLAWQAAAAPYATLRDFQRKSFTLLPGEAVTLDDCSIGYTWSELSHLHVSTLFENQSSFAL